MSNKSKFAVITAASIGVVLTQTSSLRAGNENSGAPEKVTKIVASIDVNEEVFYPALPDEYLEKTGGFSGILAAATTAQGTCSGVYCSKPQPVKKPPTSQSKKQKQ